jgi:hypothetical protein
MLFTARCSGNSDPTRSTAAVTDQQSGSGAGGTGEAGGGSGRSGGATVSGGGNRGPGGALVAAGAAYPAERACPAEENRGPGGRPSGGESGNSGPGHGGTPGVEGVAAGVRVRCEVRTGSAGSRFSVDGRDLAPGTCLARVTSGANQRFWGQQATVGDQVEFDFDSSANDIAAGATPIPTNFIQGGTVRGEVLAPGLRVVAAATAA